MFSNFAHSLPTKLESPEPTPENPVRPENPARTAGESPARAADAEWTSPQTAGHACTAVVRSLLRLGDVRYHCHRDLSAQLSRKANPPGQCS